MQFNKEFFLLLLTLCYGLNIKCTGFKLLLITAWNTLRLLVIIVYFEAVAMCKIMQINMYHETIWDQTKVSW